MKLLTLFLTVLPLLGQADFTIAMVPDVHVNEGSQFATNVGNWMTAHFVADWNGKAVIGVGDFDGQNTNNVTKQANIEAGWTLIYSKVDALGLPWITPIGNHDYDNDAPSGRRSTLFDGSDVGYTKLSTKPFFGGFWAGDPNGDKANMYIKFSVGSFNFGAVAAELFPRAGALSWAQGVIASDQNRQWIYTSHSILNCSTWVQAGDTFGGNAYGIGSDSQGAAQRDAVISNANAILGFDGHWIGCGASLFSIHLGATGTHGNVVTFVRSNWQETNPDVVTLFKFRPSIGKIEVYQMETSNNTLLSATFPMYQLDWTPISGDTITNIKVDPEETQATISYTATTTGPCTITLTDLSAEHPNVADLDTTIHGANANSDLGRTVANGFRWPSLCGGHYCSGATDDVHRIAVVGGHDEMLKYPSGCLAQQGGATGCKYISSALQSSTPHAGVVSCNGGADVGHFTFTTKIPALGSVYPEYQIPMLGFGLNGLGYVQPTVDVSNPNAVVISPEHGILLKQLAPWNSALHSTQGPFTFSKVIASVNWTNPNNFNTRQVAGTLATTSTTNDPLFAAFPIGAQDGGFDTFVSDINLVPFGSSTNHTEVSEWCISLDSGQTCANYTPIDVTFSNAVTGCQPSGVCATDTKPSNTWGNLFSTWGGMYANGQEDITNATFGGVSVSGSTVTVTPNVTNNVAGGTTTAIKFPFWLKPGVKFDLTACGTGSITATDANGHLTISSVNSYGSITTVEGPNTATNCTYTEYHAGVRVILKTAGTLNVSANMTAYRAHSGQEQSDPERWYANPAGKVNDILTNCDGSTNATPQSGYLVQLPQQYIYLIQDNGQTCKQSNMRDVVGGHFFFSDTIVSWPASNQWMANASNGDTVIATHIPNNYTALPYGDISEGTRVDNFTYAVFSGSASVRTQILARGGLAASIVNYLGINFQAVIDNGSNPAYFQYLAPTQQDAPCLVAFTDHNNNLLATVNMIGDYPHDYSGCHFGPQGSAGISIVNGQGNGEPNIFNTSVKLGGPFKAMAIATYKNGTPNKKTLAISAATNASPAVLTSAGHDLAVIANVHGTGLATCSGATDPQWNGTWFVRPVDNNTFQLYHDDAANSPLDSTTFGAIGAGMTCQVAAGIYAVPVSSVGNDGAGNARLTLNLASGGFLARFPSGVFPGTDADPICFTNTSYCTSTTQYYIKKSCAGCTTSQVDVYTDVGLTTHATQATVTALNPNLIAYAEKCPDQTSIALPGPLYTDSGWGNGASARVSCVSVEVLGHFCSSTPGPGEAAAFPCPEDPTKSMVHDYFIGDGVYELRDGTNQETGYLISHATDAHDTNAYKLTWVRSYGNVNGAAAPTGFGMMNVFGVNHGNGYALNGTNIVNQAVAINIANLGTANVAYGISGSGACGCHCEAAVPSKDIGKITTAYGWQSGCNGGNPDSVNVSITDYSLVPPAFPKQNIDPVWQFGFGSIQNTKNSYPSHRQVYPVASEQDMLWKTDQFLNITFSGNGQNFEDAGINLARTLTNVSGNIWDIGVAGTPVGGINIKTTPMLVHNLPWWYFQDKSGPGSLLSDPADMGKSCTAWIAGQCIVGSTQGHVYAVMNKVYDPGSCMANSSTNGGACAEPFATDAGWFAQFLQSPVSTNNEGVRLLTKGWWESPGHYEFYGMTPTPDGRWNLFVPMPWYRNQRYKVYSGGSWFLMKNPPMQLYDGVVRSAYIPITFTRGGGTTGDTVRLSCGYGENADPSLGHCTTYNEQCFSTTAATTSNPFVFASEAQGAVACASGCTVSFPGIPRRLAYCQLYTTNGGNTTVGPVQVVAVP